MNSLNFEDLDKYMIAQGGRIIHQVWFGTMPTKGKAKKTYIKLKQYRDSWKIKNPTWSNYDNIITNNVAILGINNINQIRETIKLNTPTTAPTTF